MGAGAEKAMYKIATILISIPVAKAVRAGVAKAWVKARPGSPSTNPKDPGADWKDAIGFAALTAAGSAATEVLIRKATDKAYVTATHMDPPPVPPTKAEKKLLKAQAKAAKADAKK
jgi:hypothetical protein